jgi:hypothetical protein
MVKSKQPPGNPMTLGNMRRLGVKRLVAIVGWTSAVVHGLRSFSWPTKINL